MNFKDGAEIPTKQPLLTAPLSTEISQNRSVLPADWRPMGSVKLGSGLGSNTTCECPQCLQLSAP